MKSSNHSCLIVRISIKYKTHPYYFKHTILNHNGEIASNDWNKVFTQSNHNTVRCKNNYQQSQDVLSILSTLVQIK